MNLTIEVEQATIKTHGVYPRLQIELENVNENDLNNEDVAKHIDIETFFNSKDERDIYDYVKHNYDWFDADFKGF
jgi:hypothetical protein